MGCIYDLLETKHFNVRTMTRNTTSKASENSSVVR